MLRGRLAALAVLVALAAGSPLATGAGASPTAAKRTVLLLGDSLTAETAPSYVPPVGWKVQVLARAGIAPCDWLTEPHPNFYDLIALHPSVVIIETAGNDITACMRLDGALPPVGSPAYFARYESSLATVVSLAERAGATVVMLAPPPLLEPHLGAALTTLLDWAVTSEHVAVSLSPRMAVSLRGAFTVDLPCLRGETARQGCVAGEIPVRTVDDKYHLHFCPRKRDFAPGFTCIVYSSGERRWAAATMRLLRTYG